MNDHDLDGALDRIHQDRARVTDSAALRERALAVPLQAQYRPGWSSPLLGFRPVLSATRFVVAGVLVALFGGFLLAGVLTTQSEDHIPAAVGSESPEASPVVTDVIEVDNWHASTLVAADGAVWAAGDGVVSRIDAATREVTDTFEVRGDPLWMRTTTDAQHLLDDATGMQDTDLRIDLARGAFTTESPVHIDPWVVTATDGTLWLQDHTETLFELDLARGTVTNEYPMPFVAWWATVIDGAIWSHSPESGLARFDLDTREVTDSYPVRIPWMSPDEGCCVATDEAIWLVSGGGTVKRFDLATREVTDTLDFDTELGKGVVAAGAIWLPGQRGDRGVVLRVDPASREVTDVIPVGSQPYGPVFADGAIWVSSVLGGTVTQIDVETREATHIDVGGRPMMPLAFDGAIWVPDYWNGTVTRIATGSDAVPSSKEDDVIKLRTPMATALALGLLATPSGGVAAQSAESPAAPVEVTGTWTFDFASCVEGTVEVVGDVERSRGRNCGRFWTVSDPRLQGTVRWAPNENVHLDGSDLKIYTGAVSIENDDGAWRQRPNWFVEFPGSTDPDPDYPDMDELTTAVEMLILDGEGGYEGMSAVVELARAEDGRDLNPMKLRGFIIDGELPPRPEPASVN